MEDRYRRARPCPSWFRLTTDGSPSANDLWNLYDTGFMPKKKEAQGAELEHFIIWNTIYHFKKFAIL